MSHEGTSQFSGGGRLPPVPFSLIDVDSFHTHLCGCCQRDTYGTHLPGLMPYLELIPRCSECTEPFGPHGYWWPGLMAVVGPPLVRGFREQGSVFVFPMPSPISELSL